MKTFKKIFWATKCGVPILIDKDIVDKLGIKEPKPETMAKGTTQHLFFSGKSK